jgi:hypothetical protein
MLRVIRYRGDVFTESLPSNDMDIHERRERFMKYAQVPRHTKFNKDWFRHSNFDVGGYTDTDRVVILFFQN